MTDSVLFFVEVGYVCLQMHVLISLLASVPSWLAQFASQTKYLLFAAGRKTIKDHSGKEIIQK
jgi:hypothetical protein